MATSSILINISIKTQEGAAQLVEALERSEQPADERHGSVEICDISLLTDKDEIKRIFGKKKIA